MTTRPDAATQSITIRHELSHTPAKVWRALTEPDLLARWLMSSDLKPVVGERFTFRANPTPWWDGIVRCEVLEVEPEKRLRYAWRSSGSDPDGLDTVVTWTLTPTATGGTILELEHSGFRPSDRPAFDGASQGWRRMVTQKLPEALSNLG